MPWIAPKAPDTGAVETNLVELVTGGTPVSASIDLDAYCARIEYQEERRPTSAVLDKLHLAHATHIPFENLDIFLGKPIRLDLNSLQAKLVRAQRGGYCFEQNT